MKTKFISLCIFSLLTLCFRTASAQFGIDWYKIAGGGGTSTGGVYSVSGTIGQHDASPAMNGGNFSLTGGFWSLFAIQTPGAPVLKILLTATNAAVITWPSPSLGWNLQQNADLGTTNWIASLESVNDNGTDHFIIVTNAASGPARFYRLRK